MPLASDVCGQMYQVLLATLLACGLKYDPLQLHQDATGVLDYYDVNGDGVLNKLEFCSLACALCPSRHEDLTDLQIQALIRHRWGCREGVRYIRRLSLDDEARSRASKKSLKFSRFQRISEQDKLFRHCLYLQVNYEVRIHIQLESSLYLLHSEDLILVPRFCLLDLDYYIWGG